MKNNEIIVCATTRSDLMECINAGQICGEMLMDFSHLIWSGAAYRPHNTTLIFAMLFFYNYHKAILQFTSTLWGALEIVEEVNVLFHTIAVPWGRGERLQTTEAKVN